MKNIRLFALLAVFSIAFMGCPYSAEVGIDDPAVKIDEKLLGKWESKSSSDYSYDVTKTDANHYKIEKKSASSGDVTTYMGFLSKIDNTVYMNVYEDGSTTKTYYFYKIEISTSGSKCTMSPVTENITEKFTTSAELKKFFQANQKNSYFYDKDQDVYIKE